MRVLRNVTEADCAVYFCRDMEDPELWAFARAVTQYRIPWFVVLCIGEGLIVFSGLAPGKKTPCIACCGEWLVRGPLYFAKRWAGLDSPGLPSSWRECEVAHRVQEWADALARHWIESSMGLRRAGEVAWYALSSDRLQFDGVRRRPQCRLCGSPRAVALEREARALDLSGTDSLYEPSECDASGASSDHRAREFLRRFEPLVGMMCGVVGRLHQMRYAWDRDEEWFFSVLGTRLHRAIGCMGIGRSDWRVIGGGKGSSLLGARAGAIAEAIERVSAVYRKDEDVFCRASALELARTSQRVFLPHELSFFSPSQFADRHEIKRRRYSYYRVPRPFLDEDCERKLNWMWMVRADDVSQGAWVPANHVLFAIGPDFHEEGNSIEDGWFCYTTSNGLAAGPTRADALARGFCELVERDAFALWWYSKAVRPEVDVGSFDDRWMSQTKERYLQAGRRIWVLDVTTNEQLPVMVAVSCLLKPCADGMEDIVVSAGCGRSARIAARRAVAENVQFFRSDGSLIWSEDMRFADIMAWRRLRLRDESWLCPDDGRGALTEGDYPVERDEDPAGFIADCVFVADALGVPFYGIDLTRPEYELPVMRAVAPGLCHFWAQYGSPRLYEAPVSMGWVKESFCEEDVRRCVPVFI